MKKSLLLAMGLAASLAANAQTAANPLTLVTGGDNTYEFSSGYATPVWIYTADEDQMVTVTPNQKLGGFAVTADGSTYSSAKLPCVAVGDSYKFIVAKDVPVYLNVTAYTSPVTLGASAEPYPYTLGRGYDDAIEITPGEESLFVPFREEKYVAVPVFFHYTATGDGALTLTFSGYAYQAYFAEGKDGEWAGITCKQQPTGEYKTFIPVEAGKDYYIKAASSTAKMLTATLEHPVFGESADFPFVLTSPEGTVPAAAGTYYYDVTGTESGYAVVSSEVTDLDGSVSWGRNVDSSLATVSDGSFDLRQPATLGGHYYLIVDKKSATDAEQAFRVDFQKRQPFDSHYDAANAPAGSVADWTLGQANALPPYSGTYYFRVTTPAEGAFILKAAPVGFFNDPASGIKLFKTTDSSTAMYIGDPDISTEVLAGTSYILEVKVAEADKRKTIDVRTTALEKGDGASNPFDVEIGQNTLAAGDNKYFLYKAEKSSWVVVTPADMSINAPTVTRLKDDKSSYDQNITILRHGDSHRFEAEAGRNYLLRFTKVKEDTAFDFAVPDYAQGETRENPFEIEGSCFTVPTEPGTYWWTYTPAESGKLTVSTDLAYDVVSSPTRENAVRIYEASSTYALTSLPIDYTAEVFNPARQNVTAGVQYLIQVVSVTPQEGATVTLEMGALDPGETPAVAIHIDYTEVPFDYTEFVQTGSQSTGKWYSIDLVEGELSILTTASISFYIYKENETHNYTSSNYVGYASTYWNDDYTQRFYGVKNLRIASAGRYYFRPYYFYNPGTAVTFSGSALQASTSGVGELTAGTDAAYTLTGTTLTASGPMTVYTVAGRVAAVLEAGESATLPAGIYIVRTATSATKIAVK